MHSLETWCDHLNVSTQLVNYSVSQCFYMHLGNITVTAGFPEWADFFTVMEMENLFFVKGLEKPDLPR